MDRPERSRARPAILAFSPLGSMQITERSRGQEVGDDRADALAAARRGHGQQMRRSVIAQELIGFDIAAEEQAIRLLRQARGLLLGGKTGRPMRVAALVAKMPERGASASASRVLR